MPIQFDLEGFRKLNNCSVYFETGLYDPREDISCKKALECNFEKVFSIELKPQWVSMGTSLFSKDIASGRLTLIHDDSANLGDYLNLIPLEERTLFFLDAHIDNETILNYSNNKCPVFKELTAIKNLSKNDHIICVDDMRIMRHPFPWNEDSEGDVNFEEKIKEFILTINPDYKFSYLNGHVENDVLIAFT
jgi:hypothetical protein